METRQEQSERSRGTIITDILNETQVYLAGGDSIGGTLLNQKIQDAATLCLDRLYPLFHLADFPAANWEKVYTRAKGGAGDAMTAVGHKGDADTHPVCKAVVDFVGSGSKGRHDIQKHFDAPKYGWPKDAINAALVVLVHAGAFRAVSASKEAVLAAKLDQKTINAVEFRCGDHQVDSGSVTGDPSKLFKDTRFEHADRPRSCRCQQISQPPNGIGKIEAGGEAPLTKCPDTNHITDIFLQSGSVTIS